MSIKLTLLTEALASAKNYSFLAKCQTNCFNGEMTP